MVYIVGIGPGARDYMLLKAIDTLEKSKVILGFKRALESIDFIKTKKKQVNSIKEVLTYLNENPKEDIAVVASGDPLYYGITSYIKENYKGEIKVVPGLSSFQFMMSKIQLPWNKSFTGSMHGREEDFIGKVKSHDISIWLTDKKNSPKELLNKLISEDMNYKVYVGENLSYEDEKITSGFARDLKSMEFSDLSVVVIEKCVL
ncbi:precorrin-6y C5,15-methyltransferase (decarboxylating) subunit CbiE [Haloimpatiens sp. FM7315]|uniref:precorrin-6y C5,15-methyltransferase (decarboxylating) subunit CbiE n=1 Tax=Haloimpatiens sp. FM7315 TaxID=3298609 RepID=UPI00370A087A